MTMFLTVVYYHFSELSVGMTMYLTVVYYHFSELSEHVFLAGKVYFFIFIFYESLLLYLCLVLLLLRY